MNTKWPDRVRLPRGRHTHGAGYIAGHADRLTACDKNAEHGTFLDEDTPITCPGCKRTIDQ